MSVGSSPGFRNTGTMMRAIFVVLDAVDPYIDRQVLTAVIADASWTPS